MRFQPFLIFVLFIMAKPVFAQVELGAKGGLNLSNLAFSVDEEKEAYTTKPSVHVGGFLNLPISKKVGFFPELLLSIKGTKEKAGPDKVSSYYISIPAILYFKPVNFLSVGLGPEFNYLLHARSIRNGRAANITQAYDNYKIDVAGDIDLKFYFKSLHVGLRYSYGFLPFDKITIHNEFGEESGTLKTFNRTLQISVGYAFIK